MQREARRHTAARPCRVINCCTDRANLCERCAADLFACLRGVAMCRADTWTRMIAARCPELRARPWPRTPKAHRLALERVADLTVDMGLRERLAVTLEARAESTWSTS